MELSIDKMIGRAASPWEQKGESEKRIMVSLAGIERGLVRAEPTVGFKGTSLGGGKPKRFFWRQSFVLRICASPWSIVCTRSASSRVCHELAALALDSLAAHRSGRVC